MNGWTFSKKLRKQGKSHHIRTSASLFEITVGCSGGWAHMGPPEHVETILKWRRVKLLRIPALQLPCFKLSWWWWWWWLFLRVRGLGENVPQCIPRLPRSGELRTQKLKSHLVRTRSLNVLPLKPGVGQYIAIHDTLTARDFFLTYFYPSGPFTCIFSKTSPDFSLCWLWLTLVPV